MNPAGAIALGIASLAVLLYLCVPRAATRIEDDLQQKAATALRRAGLPADGLSIDGRDAVLKGTPGSAQTSWQAQRILNSVDGIRKFQTQFIEPGKPDLRTPGDPAQISKLQEELDSAAKRGVSFEAGGTQLSPEGQQTLDSIAEVLSQYTQFEVEIQGHVDMNGDPAVTMELGRRRAANARIYLIAKGVAPSQLTAVGYQAASKPGGKDSSGEAKQRIEFKVKVPR
jgi:outer membrane protein OmpA-like peptidoglycan-associated protein